MKKTVPGILFCAVLGGIAFLAAPHTPLGSVTLAILAGILIGNLLPGRDVWGERMSGGFAFCEKRILTWAIALMGLNLDYRVLRNLGGGTLFLIPAAVLFTVSLALLLGRLFGLPRKLALLMGIGNAVCGSSAIAAAQGVVKADEEHVALSVAAVNLFGTVGIFLLPLLATTFFSADHGAWGLLIGNTLQAVGQVTAAGFSLDDVTGQAATVVKMGRILLIGPVVMILSLGFSRGEQRRKGPGIPSYILVFLVLSLIGSTEFIPENLTSLIGRLSKLLLVTAMSAIGLKIRFRDLVKNGGTVLLMGTAVVAGQIIFSLLVIHLLR